MILLEMISCCLCISPSMALHSECTLSMKITFLSPYSWKIYSINPRISVILEVLLVIS